MDPSVLFYSVRSDKVKSVENFKPATDLDKAINVSKVRDLGCVSGTFVERAFKNSELPGADLCDRCHFIVVEFQHELRCGRCEDRVVSTFDENVFATVDEIPGVGQYFWIRYESPPDVTSLDEKLGELMSKKDANRLKSIMGRDLQRSHCWALATISGKGVIEGEASFPSVNKFLSGEISFWFHGNYRDCGELWHEEIDCKSFFGEDDYCATDKRYLKCETFRFVFLRWFNSLWGYNISVVKLWQIARL